MYKECDKCKGIFKLNKTIVKRLENDKPVLIYCPYCSDTSNHTIVHTYEVHSQIGYIF